MQPVAIVGNLSLDRIDGGPPRVGGGPFHAARALRLLGGPAHVFARCAEGDRALLVPPLVALGLPLTVLPAASTAGFSLRYEGDERSEQVDALGDPWTPRDASALDRRIRFVHVAALVRGDFPAETLAALARGRRLSLDGQGLVRPGRTGPVVLDADFDPAVLEHVTILKLGEAEARVLEPGALGVPEVVVTRGPGGATLWVDGAPVDVPASPLAAADPTGAGDAFAAVYLAARSGGEAPAAAARRATALVAALLRGERR